MVQRELKSAGGGGDDEVDLPPFILSSQDIRDPTLDRGVRKPRRIEMLGIEVNRTRCRRQLCPDLLIEGRGARQSRRLAVEQQNGLRCLLGGAIGCPRG